VSRLKYENLGGELLAGECFTEQMRGIEKFGFLEFPSTWPSRMTRSNCALLLVMMWQFAIGRRCWRISCWAGTALLT
jgi:hypothetical protein